MTYFKGTEIPFDTNNIQRAFTLILWYIFFIHSVTVLRIVFLTDIKNNIFELKHKLECLRDFPRSHQEYVTELGLNSHRLPTLAWVSNHSTGNILEKMN